MESLLLVGSDSAALKRLKSALIRGGFQVHAVASDELERLEEVKSRCALGIVDATGSDRLVTLIGKFRLYGAAKELPLLLMLKEPHLKELAQVSPVEDFMMAPVLPEFLLVRIQFLLKRMNHHALGTGMQIGDLRLDVDRYEVTLEGEPLELTYKEFELLKFLATHPGRVFSRDQLLNQVWGYDFIGGTRTVDVHIRRLRAKLGPKYASLIATVHHVGYKFLESL